MKIISVLLVFVMLSGMVVASPLDDRLIHYGYGYGLTLTMKQFGMSNRHTMASMFVLCVGKELYDGGFGSGFDTSELACGLLGTFTAIGIYDWSLSVTPRGVALVRSW